MELTKKPYSFNIEDGLVTITELELGKFWYNYMTNKLGYICAFTHTGLVHSKYIDKNAETVRLNKDNRSCVYLRDDENMKVWNIGVSPVCEPVEDYKCVYGQEFAQISSVRDGIYASWTVGVCPDDTAEVWKVVLKNNSDRCRKISVVPMLDIEQEGFTNHGHYGARTTARTVILPDVNTVMSRSDHPHKPHPRCHVYLTSYQKADAFQGRLEKFFGITGNLGHPQELMNEQLLSGDVASVRPKCAIVQVCAELAPQEERELYFRVGLADGADEIRETYEARAQESMHLFDDVLERGNQRYGKLRTKTPDIRIDRIMNFWAEHQVDFCMMGKKAVRDNAQLALAMLNYDTELSKETLIECIEHQYASGHSVLNWAPRLEPEKFSDPSMWMMLTVCEYVKESGDFAFLDQKLRYIDDEPESVYGHLVRAVNWYMRPENIGPNGLPKIHHADWNDALNIKDANAESVFMAMGLCWAFREFVTVARRLGHNEIADRADAFRTQLAKITNDVAWNGTHYVRAFSKYGVVGDEPPVYINPQSWAILADIVPEERIPTLLDSIDKYETPEGIRLCAPAYDKYYDAVGRMSGMRPGVYESGGIYNHACAFKVMADCKLGRGDSAMRSLLAMIPDTSKYNSWEKTTTEPYVFTNCYLKNDCEDMMVGFSWQTGSSAWGLRDYYEGVLGLLRDYDGLRICPALPSDWDEVYAKRIFRGNELNVYYHNKGGKNVKLVIDGVSVDGNIVKPFKDNCAHRIDVFID